MDNLENNTGASTITEKQPTKNKNSLIIIILILVAIWALAKCSPADQELDAKMCAEEAVMARLKSPSTAEFCSYADMTATESGDNRWTVSGYVDAENSFGTVVREYFVVDLRITDSSSGDLGYIVYSVIF